MTNVAFSWNPEAPLARCPGETARASAALQDYIGMGPGRSLPKLFRRYIKATKTGQEKPPSRRIATLKKWSSKYRWQDRLACWQDMQRLEREALWRTRREEQRDWEWSMAGKLKQRIEEMLRFPLAEITRDEDGAVTVVKPVRWRQADVSQFSKTATELSRLAATLETERKAVDVSGAVVTSTAREIAEMSDDDIEQFLANHEAVQSALRRSEAGASESYLASNAGDGESDADTSGVDEGQAATSGSRQTV